jgi:hypothetical protein
MDLSSCSRSGNTVLGIAPVAAGGKVQSHPSTRVEVDRYFFVFTCAVISAPAACNQALPQKRPRRNQRQRRSWGERNLTGRGYLWVLLYTKRSAERLRTRLDRSPSENITAETSGFPDNCTMVSATASYQSSMCRTTSADYSATKSATGERESLKA